MVHLDLVSLHNVCGQGNFEFYEVNSVTFVDGKLLENNEFTPIQYRLYYIHYIIGLLGNLL